MCLKKVGVFSDDPYLFQKIKLEFLKIAETVRINDEKETEGFDLILVDTDAVGSSKIDGIKMSRTGDADISLPFRIGSLTGLLTKEKSSAIRLSDAKKSAVIDGRTVKLTELEYSLLSLLVSKKGEYVSRAEILEEIWNNRADAGIINVYIHYLREKLEAGGEKIIISSRSCGYKISEKYIGGDADA